MTSAPSPNSQKKTLRDRNQKRLTLTPLTIRALFRNVSGNEASLRYIRNARESQMISEKDKSLTYGEVEVASFQNILGYTSTHNTFKESEGTLNSRVFYDLGSGTGRAVITAALSPSHFSKVVGIELMAELYEFSMEAKDRLLNAISEIRGEMEKKTNAIEKKCYMRKSSIAIKPKKELNFLCDTQLIEKIKDIIIKKEIKSNGVCSLEFIGNELTKQLGHKIYKLSVHAFGKFSRFIEKYNQHFLLESDGAVSLVVGQPISDRSKSENCNSETDHENNSLSLCNPDIILCDISSDTFEEDIRENSLSPNNETNGVVTEEILLDEKLGKQNNKLTALKAALTSFPGSFEALFPLPEIQLIQGNIFEVKWYEDADVVYVSSLLFSDEMIKNLTAQVLKMKKGSWLISLKALEIPSNCNDKIVLRQKSFYKMSWEMAEVYIYQLHL